MFYSVKDLEAMKVNDLQRLAIGVITNRHKMKKAELVSALYSLQCEKQAKQQEVVKTEIEVSSAVCLKESETKKSKQDYISNIKIGDIIAFRISLSASKAISGKVEYKNADRLTIVTKNSGRFNIPAGSVIWVKTGPRWPRGVYLMLKGKSDDNAKTE